MNAPFWIGDREFTETDVDLIRLTVRRCFRLSREEITATLCENLPWKAPNGRLKMEACRKLLSQLEQEGIIALPPLQRHKARQGIHEEQAGTAIQLELRASLRSVAPVGFGLIGRRGMAMRPFCWRPSWSPSMRAPVIGRPIGFWWGRRPDGVATIGTASIGSP